MICRNEIADETEMELVEHESEVGETPSMDLAGLFWICLVFFFSPWPKYFEE